MIRDIICLMCPNGCHLVNATQPDGTVMVQGNRCEKGLAFARSVLAAGDKKAAIRLVGAQARPTFSPDTLKDLVAFWGVPFKRSRPNLIPEGSPERTLFRVVIEDDPGALFVLEQIPPASFHNKMKIVKTLEFLARRGMPKIAPYRANPLGQHIQEHATGLWQLVPFPPGVHLDRGAYMYEGWRGDVLGDFLIALNDKAQGIPFFALDEAFSIKKYIYQLFSQVQKRESAIAGEVGRVVAFLEKDFMAAHDALPVAFCHGDYHPLNIVWAAHGIEAVIDWEFLGMKPEIYDLANMTGCLGMEHPSSLTRDLVVGLVRKIKASGIYTPSSWQYFVEFVVALRFAWLSEWLRKDDREMVAMELEYMGILISGREDLQKIWKIG